jgi:hypothetical protein
MSVRRRLSGRGWLCPQTLDRKKNNKYLVFPHSIFVGGPKLFLLVWVYASLIGPNLFARKCYLLLFIREG